jgi:outer membrane protein assembly factor BamD (BamD/ComL family)
MSQANFIRLRSFRWLLLLLGPMLAACSDTKDLYVERPVETLYNLAMDDLADESYTKAAK